VAAFEQAVQGGETTGLEPANSMLVIMVTGLFRQFEFPYCQFSCTALSGDQINIHSSSNYKSPLKKQILITKYLIHNYFFVPSFGLQSLSVEQIE